MRQAVNRTNTSTNHAAAGIRQIFTGHGLRFLAPGRLVCWNQGLGWWFGGICRNIARRLGISGAIGWIKSAERACASLGPDDVDLILASGPPFASFVLAEHLSKKLARPYILDYRDPWWTEVTEMIRPLQPVIDRLEARLVAGSTAITTVSPSWADDLDAKYKVKAKLHVITNGYDPEDLAHVKPHNFGHFAIVYAGIFYPPDRVVTPLLAALKRLEMKSPTREWYFHYFGDHDRHVREEAGQTWDCKTSAIAWCGTAIGSPFSNKGSKRCRRHWLCCEGVRGGHAWLGSRKAIRDRWSRHSYSVDCSSGQRCRVDC